MAEYKELQTPAEYFHDNIPWIMEGQVVDTNDPNQMGRVRAWIPALDGESFDIDTIPWADYASPFGGFTVAYPAGENTIPNNSNAAYGFWAIPKIGSTVCVFCMNGSPTSRFYFASTLRLHRNRSLPAGRNTDFNGKQGPWGDAGDGSGNLNPIQPAYNNLRTQFQNKTTQSEAITRGAYENAVAQGSNNRDGSDGYTVNPADPSYLDPQTYCLVTPGRQAIIMQDDPHFARLRLKTAEGHQIIFDDANERIYVSTSKGNTWFEMDQDGHVNVFGAQSISFRTGGDFNVYADGNINMEAGKGFNLITTGGDARITTSQSFQVAASQNIVQSACGIFDMNVQGAMHLTASDDLDLRSNQGIYATGDSGVEIMSGAGMDITAANNIDVNGENLYTTTSKTTSIGSNKDIIISGMRNVGMSGLNTIVEGIASLGFNLQLIGGNTASNTVILTEPVGDVPGPIKAGTANTADEATCADQAAAPSVVPGFEPWTRPASTTPRGPFWKP